MTFALKSQKLKPQSCTRAHILYITKHSNYPHLKHPTCIRCISEIHQAWSFPAFPFKDEAKSLGAHELFELSSPSGSLVGFSVIGELAQGMLQPGDGAFRLLKAGDNVVPVINHDMISSDTHIHCT